MRKIIIDCDPGHDDIMAVFTALAHAEELEILGITTVSGNQTLAKVTANILKVQDYFGLHIPVYMGYDSPIIKPREVQPAAHGESGMDGPVLPDPVSKPQPEHALDYLRRTLETEDKVTLVALAPLTNIALFLKTYPHLAGKIECIAMMGGAVNGGNIQKKSEFNIWQDPEAAAIVFASGAPVVMAGLEVCNAGSILLSEAEEFRHGGKVSKFCYDLMKFYGLYAVNRGWDRTPIFDITPVIWLLYPELFKAEQMDVDIELNGEFTRGMTVCTPTTGRPHTVLLDTDREAFIGVFLAALKKLDQMYG